MWCCGTEGGTKGGEAVISLAELRVSAYRFVVPSDSHPALLHRWGRGSTHEVNSRHNVSHGLRAVRTGNDRTHVGSYICTEVRGLGDRSVAGLSCRLSCTYSKGPSEDTRVLHF